MDWAVCVRVERISRTGCGVETGKLVSRRAADGEETPAHENFAVRLHRDRKDIAVRVRVKAGIKRAVRVETGDIVARDRRPAVWRNARKITADKDLAVRLHDNGANRVVRIRVKPVERASARRYIDREGKALHRGAADSVTRSEGDRICSGRS